MDIRECVSREFLTSDTDVGASATRIDETLAIGLHISVMPPCASTKLDVRAIIRYDNLVQLAEFQSDTDVDVVCSSPRRMPTSDQTKGATVLGGFASTL